MIWEFGEGENDFSRVREALRVFGFALIRNVLDPDEVSLVRAELDLAFGIAGRREMPTLYSTEILKHERVWRALFNERVVRSLRAALGPELYYQHDLDVQRNSYGLTGWKLHSGWHMDAGSETGNDYLRSAAYRFVKCGIYLQDFDNSWGGGIRVKPKSHRGLFEPDRFKRHLFFCRRALNRIALMLRMDVDSFEVPTKAGDLCFFDSRLLHSSVPPSLSNIKSIGYDRQPEIRVFWPDIPKAFTKYVIYWDACNAAMVDDFLRNSVKRANNEPVGMIEHPLRPIVYSRILSLKYPDDFPAAFVAEATGCNVGVASLPTQDAAFYKKKLKTMQLAHSPTGP